MSVRAVLSYSSIYSWLLNSCMPHFPTLFFPGFFPNTWQLPDFLSSAPVLKWLLLLLHTHTLLHFPLRGRGGWLKDFQFCSPPPWFCPGAPRESFIFSSAIPSSVHLGKKPTAACTSPLPLTSFPRVLHLLVRGVFQSCCALPAASLHLYTKGDSGRVSPRCHDSCHCRGFTLAVLHVEGLSEHILRLHDTIDVRSKNVYLSSGLDTAQ